MRDKITKARERVQAFNDTLVNCNLSILTADSTIFYLISGPITASLERIITSGDFDHIENYLKHYEKLKAFW